MTTPDQTTIDRPAPAANARYSLTKAAKHLKMGKATLKAAIVRGELNANTTEEGHYQINAVELWQFEARLNEERARLAEPDRRRSQPTSDSVDSPDQTTSVPDSRPVNPTGQTTTDVVPRFLHDEMVNLYKAQVQDRDSTINTLRADMDLNRTQQRTMMHLLTDQREPVQPTPPKRRSRILLWVLLPLLIGVGAGWLYRHPEIWQQWIS